MRPRRSRENQATEPILLGAPMDLRLLPAAAGAWASAWVVTQLPANGGATVGVMLLLSGLACAVGRPARRSGALVLVLVICAAAALGAALRVRSVAAGPVASMARERSSVRLSGVLTADPMAQVVRSGPGAGRPYVLARLRAEAVISGHWSGRVRTPVLVLTDSRAWLGLLPGQRVEVVGRLSPARGRDSIAGTLSARVAPRLLGRPGLEQRVAGQIRAGLATASERAWGDGAGLLPAMVLGDTSSVSPQLDEAFRRSGLTHVMAVSGANLAIIGGAVLVLVRSLRAPPRIAALASGLAILVFVLLARPQPSVLRAAVMAAGAVMALAVGRRRDTVAALSAAVMLLVLTDPWLSRSWSFALSVAATGGILALTPPWTRSLARFLPRWLALAVAVPASAQVACFPLLVALSGQVGLWSLVANLVAGPAVAPATVLGALAAVVATVSPTAAGMIAWVAGWPAQAVASTARLVAAAPGAALPMPGGTEGSVGLLVVAGLGWWAWRSRWSPRATGRGRSSPML